MKAQKEFHKENRKNRQPKLKAKHAKQQQAIELQKLEHAKQQQAIELQKLEHAKQQQAIELQKLEHANNTTIIVILHSLVYSLTSIDLLYHIFDSDVFHLPVRSSHQVILLNS